MHTGAHTSPTVGCRPSATPACTAASSGLRQGSGYAPATSKATLLLRPNLAALYSDAGHGSGASRSVGEIPLLAAVPDRSRNGSTDRPCRKTEAGRGGNEGGRKG